MPGMNDVTEAVTATPLPIPIAPGRLPVLGHMLPMIRRPHEFLCSLTKIGPLVRVDIGGQSMIVVTDATLTRQVLKNNKAFDKGGALYDKARDLVGAGLLTSQAQDHLRQRRMLQPVFHQHRIKNHAAIMSEVIESVLGEWQDGAVTNITETAYKITSYSAARTMFAAQIAAQDVARIVEALLVYLQGMFVRMIAPDTIRPLLTMHDNARYKQAVHTLHASVDKIIAAYQASGTDHCDLLSMLLVARDDDGSPLTAQEIRDQVISMFVAGIETTASVISWSLYLVGRHPDVASNFYSEVDTVLDGRAAQWDDLAQLNETKRIITESLRIYPPGWIFTRVTMQPVMLGEYHLPQGTGLAYSPYLLHRSPEIFEQPERFDPDRWLPQRMANVSLDGFVPFGGGVHKCIGDNFGVTEATLALATIASRWTLQPTQSQPVQPVPRRAVLAPGPIPMRICRRKHAVQ